MVKPYYIRRSVHRVKKKQYLLADVIESFAKFTGKHLYWNHFLIKLQAKRESIASVFL